jgi:hypothetical protein
MRFNSMLQRRPRALAGCKSGGGAGFVRTPIARPEGATPSPSFVLPPAHGALAGGVLLPRPSPRCPTNPAHRPIVHPWLRLHPCRAAAHRWANRRRSPPGQPPLPRPPLWSPPTVILSTPPTLTSTPGATAITSINPSHDAAATATPPLRATARPGSATTSLLHHRPSFPIARGSNPIRRKNPFQRQSCRSRRKKTCNVGRATSG